MPRYITSICGTLQLYVLVEGLGLSLPICTGPPLSLGAGKLKIITYLHNQKKLQIPMIEPAHNSRDKRGIKGVEAHRLNYVGLCSNSTLNFRSNLFFRVGSAIRI